MTNKHEVKCRICKQKFDIAPLIEGVDWLQKSKGWYYHKKCYDDWQTEKDNVRSEFKDQDLWKDATYQYLMRDLKILVDYHKFNSQFQSLIKKGKTPKGIYFAVRYFYEIEHGDKDKAKGGIGIVEYVYSRSASYWAGRQRENSNILEQIEAQIRAQQERETITIHREKKTKKKKFSLEMVEEMGDD